MERSRTTLLQEVEQSITDIESQIQNCERQLAQTFTIANASIIQRSVNDSASQHNDSASQHNDSASQHNDSASQHNRISATQHLESAHQQPL